MLTLNQHMRSVIKGHGLRAKAKPGGAIRVGLWRPTASPPARVWLALPAQVLAHPWRGARAAGMVETLTQFCTKTKRGPKARRARLKTPPARDHPLTVAHCSGIPPSDDSRAKRAAARLSE
jgi:hypothetical protein